jgi:hypothetical protein
VVRDIPGFPVGVVRIQHLAQIHRRLYVPEHRIMEIAFQAPHVRVLAGGTDSNSDDCVLRSRRNYRNVQVEVI